MEEKPTGPRGLYTTLRHTDVRHLSRPQTTGNANNNTYVNTHPGLSHVDDGVVVAVPVADEAAVYRRCDCASADPVRDVGRVLDTGKVRRTRRADGRAVGFTKCIRGIPFGTPVGVPVKDATCSDERARGERKTTGHAHQTPGGTVLHERLGRGARVVHKTVYRNV